VPDRPAVSVIIPNRDCLTFLPRAVAAIGPAPGIEIIVLDDGSTDGSRVWLAQQAQRDNRLRVLLGPGNGPAKSRNTAIGAARGRLLAFLNATDCWGADKFATQLALHRTNPDLAFSFTDYHDVDADGAEVAAGFANFPCFRTRHATRAAPFVLENDALAQLYAETVVKTSTVVARTDLVRELGGFDPNLPGTEAWDLWLRLAARGPVGCIPSVLADHLVDQPMSNPNSKRSLVLGMRMIAARHAAAVERLNARAARVFVARLLAADADVADAANRPWRAAWLRLHALRNVPTRGATRAAAGALLHALALV
jgi:glycosyltransferase involved in cell wall biosynthesis